MKNNRRLLASMFTALLVVLSGCGNSSANEGILSKVDQSAEAEVNVEEVGSVDGVEVEVSDVDKVNDVEDVNGESDVQVGGLDNVEDVEHVDVIEVDAPDDVENVNDERDVQVGDTDGTTSSLNEETTSDRDNNEANVSQKEDYLKKLNRMEEEDRNLEAGTTMQELEQQEADRYEKWDDELNRIYGILQDQLSTEQMDELREEQREWIKYRDETAKESSLKYEGSSTESLEYVATLATLTRERCYLLVAKYMN